MRFYNHQHQYYGGIDLHVKTMYVCILDATGQVLVHRNVVQEFASYARLVKCVHQSAGKKLGTGGAKMGNVHLNWAFSEAAVLFLRHTKDGKKILAGIEKKHGTGKALSILAHTIGRAVFYMLSRGTVFSMEKFLAA
jgi:transposase